MASCSSRRERKLIKPCPICVFRTKTGMNRSETKTTRSRQRWRQNRQERSVAGLRSGPRPRARPDAASPKHPAMRDAPMARAAGQRRRPTWPTETVRHTEMLRPAVSRSRISLTLVLVFLQTRLAGEPGEPPASTTRTERPTVRVHFLFLFAVSAVSVIDNCLLQRILGTHQRTVNQKTHLTRSCRHGEGGMKPRPARKRT